MNYKGRDKQKSRSCPKCGRLMVYSSHTNMLFAEENKTCCKDCREGKYLNPQNKQYHKNCPKCGQLMGYNNKYDMLKGIKNNSTCHLCSHKYIGEQRKGKTVYDIWVEKGMSKEEALVKWRNMEERRLKTRKGYRHSPETLRKIKKGGISKTLLINGLECQGSWEKKYIETLIKEGKILPINGKIYNTPIGNYVADFEFPEKIIEIKSLFTYRIFNKEILGLDKKYSNQKERLLYVANNIKPVELLVLNQKGEIIKKEIYNTNVK